MSQIKITPYIKYTPFVDNDYRQEVQNRSLFRFIIGAIARIIPYIRFVRARKIARNRGAQIGENVFIPISLAHKLNSNVTIGNNVVISTDKITSIRYPLTIGNNVIIGKDVRITMGGHNIDSPDWEFCRQNEGLCIGDYVWICPDSKILSTCSSIDYGAVVGTEAVVTKDVPKMSVVVGFPGKVIRERLCVHKNVKVETLVGGDLVSYLKARKWL